MQNIFREIVDSLGEDSKIEKQNLIDMITDKIEVSIVMCLIAFIILYSEKTTIFYCSNIILQKIKVNSLL